MNWASRQTSKSAKPLIWATLISLPWACLSPLPGLTQLQDQPSQPQQERAAMIREGDAYLSEGKFSEAEATFQSLIEKYPEDEVLRYKLGKVLFNQRKFEAAIAAYQEAVRLDKNYAVAHNAMGLALANQGRMDEAIVAFQQAVTINADYADAQSNLGRGFWIQGKRSDAIAALEKAKALFEKQGRFQDVRQIEQLLQQIKTADPGAA